MSSLRFSSSALETNTRASSLALSIRFPSALARSNINTVTPEPTIPATAMTARIIINSMIEPPVSDSN